MIRYRRGQMTGGGLPWVTILVVVIAGVVLNMGELSMGGRIVDGEGVALREALDSGIAVEQTVGVVLFAVVSIAFVYLVVHARRNDASDVSDKH